jgi:hypothetical protein
VDGQSRYVDRTNGKETSFPSKRCREPRVVLVNAEPVSTRTANGMTLRALFGGWEPSDLLEVVLEPLSNDGTTCGTTRWEGGAALVLRYRALGRLRSRFEGVRTDKGGPETRSEGEQPPASRASRGARGLAWIRGAVGRALSTVDESRCRRVGGGLRTLIEEFQPDLVYSTLGNLKTTRMVAAMGREFELPVVPHFMDDWLPAPETARYDDRAAELYERVTGIVERAPARLAIGDEMADEFRRRFGVPFVPFMNCVDVSAYGNKERSEVDRGVTRFVYIGGVHLGRLKVLCSIACALERLRALNRRVRLDVFATNVAGHLLDGLRRNECVSVREPVSSSEIPDVLAEMDVALHVEGCGEYESHYARWSLSTKLPEYLASGLPILAVGPPDFASVRYLLQNRCAIAVRPDDESGLLAAVEALVVDKRFCREMGAAGRSLAWARHDAAVVRPAFKETLARAAIWRG